jgi:transposase
MTSSLYCGIDLHSNNSVVSVQDNKGRQVYEKRLPNELAIIIDALEPYREELQGCVVESTYNWYWLVDGLMDVGHHVHLANPAAIKQYSGIKHTNDFTDARFLAHLLSLNILPTGYIYPKETRGIRDLLRRRLLLVNQRSCQRTSLQSLLARHTGKRLSERKLKSLSSEDLKNLLPIPCVSLMAETFLTMIDSITQAISQLEDAVSEHCLQQKNYHLLTSISGVGKILGATIALETGNIQRFPNAGHYLSYARCVNSQKMSNGKIKGHNNRKNGNRYLGLAFMQAAHMATIWDPRVKRFYQKKQSKVHIMVAKKSVAGKLGRAVYHMLLKQEPFDVERAFG